MSADKQAEAIVGKMMETDAFSQWLGIDVLDVKQGYCKLAMKVRPEMCNGLVLLTEALRSPLRTVL